MAPQEEVARALTEVGHLRQVVDDLRGLLAAAVAAERRAEEATGSEPEPPPS